MLITVECETLEGFKVEKEIDMLVKLRILKVSELIFNVSSTSWWENVVLEVQGQRVKNTVDYNIGVIDRGYHVAEFVFNGIY